MDREKKIYIGLGIILALIMTVIVLIMYRTQFVQHMFGF